VVWFIPVVQPPYQLRQVGKSAERVLLPGILFGHLHYLDARCRYRGQRSHHNSSSGLAARAILKEGVYTYAGATQLTAGWKVIVGGR